jgi:hypothetical protein
VLNGYGFRDSSGDLILIKFPIELLWFKLRVYMRAGTPRANAAKAYRPPRATNDCQSTHDKAVRRDLDTAKASDAMTLLLKQRCQHADHADNHYRERFEECPSNVAITLFFSVVSSRNAPEIK